MKYGIYVYMGRMFLASSFDRQFGSTLDSGNTININFEENLYLIPHLDLFLILIQDFQQPIGLVSFTYEGVCTRF
jgi:hypothetical protein